MHRFRLLLVFTTLLAVNRWNVRADSSYAKVAKWGAGQQPELNDNEGRSNNGQSLFTHRADVNLRGGQNLKNHKMNDDVVYHYSMSAGKQPAVKKQGFQDRFNPPAIFLFGDPKRNNGESQNGGDQSLVFSESKKTLYDSPISSYNPIPAGIPNHPKFQMAGPTFPPFAPTQAPSSINGVYLPPDAGNSNESNDNDNNDNNDSDSGKGNGDMMDYNDGDPNDKPSMESLDSGYQYNPPDVGISLTSPQPMESMESMEDQPMMNQHHHPKFPAYVYDGNTSDIILDHPPTYHKHHHHAKPPPLHQHHHQSHDYPTFGGNFKAEDLDNLPEYVDHDPTLDKVNYPMIGNYQYEDHHDHPIYHEIKTTTTTTTQAPPPPEEEKRVNKGHYSYYYLGRKLYYVPLYFSVYFIIYITVLILKSIARHKVTFVHDLRDVNKGRSMSDNDVVDDMAEHTTKAITSFRRRFIAM